MHRSIVGIIIVVLVASIIARPVFASTTDGTIDGTSKYAWGENIGWLHLGTTEGNVHVTDTGLTGYLWGENVGWISLSCSNTSTCGTVNYGVSNSAGTLSGYAWGENIGWIHFAPSGGGVTIDSSGVFAGYAWGENIGWVVFNCATTSSCEIVDFKTVTDWRPASARTVTTTSGAAGGGSATSVYSAPTTTAAPAAVAPALPSIFTPGPSPLPAAVEIPPTLPPVPPAVPAVPPEPAAPALPPMPPVPSIAERIGDLVAPILPVFPVPPSILSTLPSVLTDLPRAIALALPGIAPSAPPPYIGTIALPTVPPTEPPPSIALALPSFKEPTLPPPTFAPPTFATPETPQPTLRGLVATVVESLPDRIALALPDFLKPVVPSADIPPPSVADIPAEPPPALAGTFDLVAPNAAEQFLFAPLPREFAALTEKFPSLGESLTAAGIGTLADVGRIATADLTLPGLTAAVGLQTAPLAPTPFDIPHGVPVAAMSDAQRQAIPTDIVFSRGGGELVDLPIGIAVTDTGMPKQHVATIAGQTMQLVVRPQERVERVKGYVVYRRRRPPAASEIVPLRSLAASLLFATPVLAHPHVEPVTTVEELVVVEFEYTDPDGDGVYTAEIPMPIVAGEYEVITVMDYEDPLLGAKEIRLTTVVDPEGYVFERVRGQEMRIRDARVTIERWDVASGAFTSWPADLYRQENPQVTGPAGAYSFLVPEGQYRLRVTATGYTPYIGAPFEVREGSGIHQNIELERPWWGIAVPDVRTVILMALLLLVLYNFYRDYRRGRGLPREAKPPETPL